MIEVKVGSTIPFDNAKKGTGARGPYVSVEVKADKGYDKIKVWATNPLDATSIEKAAKIVSIKSAKISAHEYNGKWYSDYSINAELKQGDAKSVEFVPVDMPSEEELPFA